MNNKPLTGMTILNTRPIGQAEALSQKIMALGGTDVSFPTMEIIPPKNIKPLKKMIASLNHYDIAIFVSANAVCMSAQHFQPLLPKMSVVVMGPGTATALKQYGVLDYTIPIQYNSEGILSLPLLQTIKQKEIVIFCGENSRPLLKEVLTRRGAKLTLAECYRRQCPAINETHKKVFQEYSIDMIVSTSQENLNNLYKILDGGKCLRFLQTPLLVISPEMKTLANTLGWKTIIMAPNASTQAITETLCRQA